MPAKLAPKASPDSSGILITSPIGFWLSRILVAIFLVSGLLVWFSLIPAEIAYYQEQAAQINSNILSLFYVYFVFGIRAIVKLIYVATGLFLYWQKPDSRMVVLTAIWLIAFGTAAVNFTNAISNSAELISNNSLYLLYETISFFAWILLLIFIWLFPDGRLVTRWAIIPIILTIILAVFWSLDDSSPLSPDNWPVFLFLPFMLFIWITPIVSHVYRYRKLSTPSQRQQTKWALFGFLIAMLTTIIVLILRGIFTDIFAPGMPALVISFLVGDVIYLSMPIALWFAFLHNGLWDIDLVINRSLVYGIFAAIVIALFFVLIALIQIVAGRTQPLVALLIAGIVSAVIFNPVQKHIQNLIDRYVYNFRFNLNELNQAQQSHTILNPGALTGQILGDYEVRGLIGKGGMGEVYQGFGQGQIVAIKTMLPEIARDIDMRIRFEREADAGKALQHPTIAKVFGSGTIDGTPYLIMEYIDGQDLRSSLKNDGAFDEETAVQILQDVCSALDMAHAEGFVHRDIKPANIMLRENGEAVLMDFGITKTLDATSSLTGTGAIGTIDYMAPEQIMSAKTVDQRADIYALGIVAFELLTGEKPFKGSAAQVMFAHIQQPPPYARDINPDIPEKIAEAIEKAMAKNPDARFATAGDFAKAISI